MAAPATSAVLWRSASGAQRGRSRAGRALDRPVMRLIVPVVPGALLLVLWHVVARSGLVPSLLLPTPAEVVTRLWWELASGQLLDYARSTVTAALLGSLSGATLAFPLGYLIARRRLIAAALHPYVAASQALPAVAVAPLLVLWVGYGLTPVVLLCALIVFFPILLATILGLRTIEADLVDAARLDGAAGWWMLRHIEIPLALPSLLTGLRNGVTLSITGAVVGEFVTGGHGLGLLLTVQASRSDATGLFATIALLITLAVLLYTVLRGVERLAWYERDAPAPHSTKERT